MIGFGSALARMSSVNQPRSSSWRCSGKALDVHARLPPHEVVDLVVRVDRLAGVAPEAADDIRLHRAAADVPVVHVGDLELTTRGRRERRQEVPDLRVVEVDARHGEARRRCLRLLDDIGHPVAVHHRNAEMAQMLVLRKLGKRDARTAFLALEVLDDRPERLLEDVVGEQHAHLVAGDEPLGEPERIGDAARVLLVAVEELVDAVVVAVSEQAEELAGMRATGDEHQLVDAGADERLDRVRHHRPVVQRQEVLVRDPRQRVQTRARSAREDDAFHASECRDSRAMCRSRAPRGTGGRAVRAAARSERNYGWIGRTSRRTVKAPIRATIRRNPAPLVSMC